MMTAERAQEIAQRFIDAQDLRGFRYTFVGARASQRHPVCIGRVAHGDPDGQARWICVRPSAHVGVRGVAECRRGTGVHDTCR